MTNIVLFFLGQSVIIIGAILLAYVRTQVAIAHLQEGVAAVRANTVELKNDHSDLVQKVDGISIAVAKLQGHVSGPNGLKHKST